MVQLKEAPHVHKDGSINIEAWIAHMAQHRNPSELRLIRSACVLSQITTEDKSKIQQVPCLEQGIAMAEILADLNMDAETIAAALVLESVQYGEITLEDVSEHLGKTIAKLVAGVERMVHMDSVMGHQSHHDNQRVDTLRKMLLGMVDDVRVVFIKLAERTYTLRQARFAEENRRRQLALEVQDIYAPLAHRLGIGQLKWELEDLAFHYLEPITYKKIAKMVDERRVDRERYVADFLKELTQLAQQAGVVKYEIQGRAKHIYSIHRKMTRKKVGFDQIYDATAVRVLVETLEDCYAVLSAVHTHWPHISEEFDDYVANPKPNGYRSIHTAVVGPAHKNVEVQIRTFAMHQESEMGFAAHWKYKEGATQKTAYEDKIALLRQVLEWQSDLAASGKALEEIPADVFKDRVYVFTPGGDIVDLPQGATPLDFAYHVHSEIGHRCRGAKINEHIVPLTYTLETGDRVEILTHKQPKPSRDWLSAEAGYLKTSRAKAKVHHWFRQLDYDAHLKEGHEIMARELKQHHLATPNFDKIADKLNYRSGADLLASLGHGDLRAAQILNLAQADQPKEKPDIQHLITQSAKLTQKSAPITEINIQGVDNLLTNMARCCKPVPGDTIIGYITTGRGVTIHRHDCSNIKPLLATENQRLIEVTWGTQLDTHYPVDLYVYARDRHSLVRDITLTLTQDHIDIISMHMLANKANEEVMVALTVRINHLNELSKIMTKLKQISDVTQVKRQQLST